jgi:hypothetical protein
MSVNDTSKIVIDDSRMMLQIVTSLGENSRGVIYNCKMFIVLAPGHVFMSILLQILQPIKNLRPCSEKWLLILKKFKKFSML